MEMLSPLQKTGIPYPVYSLDPLGTARHSSNFSATHT